MFRLLAAAALAGSLLAAGTAVRGAALRDWDAPLELRACHACRGPVVFDPTTDRSAPCGACAPPRPGFAGRMWDGRPPLGRAAVVTR